ncbi:hypothetical protein J7E96_02625 [Streptomyces sp. ISL-96]|uniref:hypothetical protein n=1 Tax=Streptomyces sp. ISL-96 TaxID=2819191 RepID=UPI001BEC7AD9|nr:hypothetical protein [Streptomyces sp. ISL-96]MBT2487452.1 hypothetical protein [Streptomyces sp. ISL-96]
MHSRIATRRIAASAVAGAAALAVLAPTASAMDATAYLNSTQAVAQAEAKQPAQLTVKNYTAYLKHQKTPEARKALNAFTKLPADKQARFVKYLQNRNIYKAFSGQAKGKIDRPLKVVDSYNKDVKFVTEVTSKTDQAVQGKSVEWISFTVTERIFNVPVTSETLNLRYQFDKGKVTDVLRAGSEVKNVNAAIAIHKGKVARRGHHAAVATASTVWTIYPLVKSFGKDLDKVQEVASGSGTWKAKLATR